MTLTASSVLVVEDDVDVLSTVFCTQRSNNKVDGESVDDDTMMMMMLILMSEEMVSMMHR